MGHVTLGRLLSLSFALVLLLSSITFAELLSNGLTEDVQWDQFSLVVKGQRIFLHSGEFHPFRLPVPSLWLDILQKIRSAGMNAISVYIHWGMSNPSPGVVNLEGVRALQPLFEAALAAGVWIVLRPGPYINGETTAGGIAHWATSQVAGTVRSNATDYHDAWQDYIKAVINATVPYQITEGGPVIAIQIDNEFSQDGYGRREYFQELKDAYRAGGIVVPFTYNDPGQGKNFVNGTGSVDIYGFDAYPQRYDCINPDTWNPVGENYHDFHLDTNPSQPLYLPEYQGGSLNAWGPQSASYDGCRELTNAQFEEVFYKSLWAANAKMVSYYMLYGGTSWGYIAFPGVYSSYDYGGAISENRVVTSKLVELKRQGYFLRSSPEFYKTEWVGNSTSGVVNVSNPNALIVFLENPDTGAGFYIARQRSSISKDVTGFSFDIETTFGPLHVPKSTQSLRLNGRQSKVIVTNYLFGSSRVVYSTASVFFAGKIGARDVLFLYGDSDQVHEAVLLLKGTSGSGTRSRVPQIRFSASGIGANTMVSILDGAKGLFTVWDSDTQLVLYCDTETTEKFFVPLTPKPSKHPLANSFHNYWQLGTNDSVIVGGPHLVREASFQGSHLFLSGDLNESTTLTVIAPSFVTAVNWNDQVVEPDTDAPPPTKIGGFVGRLRMKRSIAGVSLPELSEWKFRDGIPEILREFSDDNWIVADHTSTNSPYKPYYGDGRVLYGCDYGFCEGAVLWRGHFNATGNEKSVNLSINGGEAFGASIWFNGVFINSTSGRRGVEETDQVFPLPLESLRIGEDNVITVLQDNMGVNQLGYTENGVKSPRGVRGFKLNNGTFGEWRVQGKIGGYTNFPDRVRGILNEGGLFGEREGWHLPGFDTNSWVKRPLSSGLPDNNAGVGFFVTTFDLDIPEGTDVPLSFNFDDGVPLAFGASGQPYRALLFVNGWMMGKRVAYLGPQAKFPVHEGILNYRGKNTVVVVLWVTAPDVRVSPNLVLTADAYFEGGVGRVVTNNPEWTSRTELKN